MVATLKFVGSNPTRCSSKVYFLNRLDGIRLTSNFQEIAVHFSLNENELRVSLFKTLLEIGLQLKNTRQHTGMQRVSKTLKDKVRLFGRVQSNP